MDPKKTIAIIGAGASGLVAAKTCFEQGYQVKVFEKDRELGGVWSKSQRQAGLNNYPPHSYGFSDFPLPADLLQWPPDQRVQEYLLSYAIHFRIYAYIHFSHEITSAEYKDSKWVLRGHNIQGSFTELADFLIVCNGFFSDPHIPALPGAEVFVNSGGKLLHCKQFHSTALSQNKNLVVEGYNNAAIGLISAACREAKKAILLFDEPKWKLPQFFRGINLKNKLWSRLGEVIFNPCNQRGMSERAVRSLRIREKILAYIEDYILKKQMLQPMRLVPGKRLKEYLYNEIALETPCFLPAVRQERIILKRASVVALGKKTVELSTGESLCCDVLVFSGCRHSLSFFSESQKDELMDKEGNCILYHHILSTRLPALGFVGYNPSAQHPLSFEFQVLWLCQYLQGKIPLPSEADMERNIQECLSDQSRFRQKEISWQMNIMAGFYHMDRLLHEMKASLPPWLFFAEWVLPLRPNRYRRLKEKILKQQTT